MLEGDIETAMVATRCNDALDGWSLDEDERRNVLTCGIGPDEPGAPVALETRSRHIVDVERSVACLVGRASLVLAGSGSPRKRSTA